MASAAAADPPALELRGLGKTYGSGSAAKRAVADISLRVHPGEVYGFLGANGAGKSTTIRMALGLIRPDAGEILLFGRPGGDRLALARVGSLVDGGTFYNFLTGRDNLRVLARTRGHEAPPIAALLDRVGLGRDADRKVKNYSMGMRQRLGVAAALLGDPDLVILDEPANGLDAAGIQDMRSLVRSLADEGKAVFLSSHLLHEVEQVCDRLAIVADGRLLREATVKEMLGVDEALWIEARPIDRARQLLQGRWPVEPVEDGLRVQARRDEGPAIMRLLVGQGVDVFGLSAHAHRLEDIFLAMTRKDDA